MGEALRSLTGSPLNTPSASTPLSFWRSRTLAARGLKDPWLRNEAWRYARGGAKRYNPFFMTYNFIRPRAFFAGVVVALITSQVKIRYFDKKWEEENAHLYHHH